MKVLYREQFTASRPWGVESSTPPYNLQNPAFNVVQTQLTVCESQNSRFPFNKDRPYSPALSVCVQNCCAALCEKAMESGGIFVRSGERGSRQICMNALVRLFVVSTDDLARI